MIDKMTLSDSTYKKIIIGLFSLPALYLGTAFLYDTTQRPQMIKDVKVESIKDYVVNNDLHLYTHGKKVRIEGIDSQILFSDRTWEKDIKEGDLVNMVVKETIIPNSLRGITID